MQALLWSVVIVVVTFVSYLLFSAIYDFFSNSPDIVERWIEVKAKAEREKFKTEMMKEQLLNEQLKSFDSKQQNINV